jgi:hypothetical protein
MDAEILRAIKIRPAIAAHEPPERQIRDVLHGRKDEERFAAAEQSVK